MLYPNGTTKRPDISSPYGKRTGSSQNGFHYGTDFVGFPMVRSIAAGKVTLAKYLNDQAGNTVAVDIASSKGTTITIVYMHLATINVTVGQKIAEGAPIGKMGATGNATGPCCHLEVRTWENGKCTWTDPVPWLAARVSTARKAKAVTNVRTMPTTTNGRRIGSIAKGTLVQAVGYVHGQVVENNACWYKLSTGYYAWTGGFERGAGGVAGLPLLH